MLTRVLDFVVGREPVATATGIAAVVTAALGVGAAFGLDLTAEQIAAIGAFIAAMAGWLARRAVTPTRKLSQPADTLAGGAVGSIPLALIILVGLAVALMAGLAVCGDALFEDEDERDDLGIELVSHEYDRGDEDYDNDGEDNRRAGISPGPFDRSPVDFRDNCISLDCSGRGEEEVRTQSLFPPSFEGVKTFVLSTIKSGLEMGRLFAETTITFVENLLFGIA